MTKHPDDKILEAIEREMHERILAEVSDPAAPLYVGGHLMAHHAAFMEACGALEANAADVLEKQFDAAREIFLDLRAWYRDNPPKPRDAAP